LLLLLLIIIFLILILLLILLLLLLIADFRHLQQYQPPCNAPTFLFLRAQGYHIRWWQTSPCSPNSLEQNHGC
jgi:hypothetical protein